MRTTTPALVLALTLAFGCSQEGEPALPGTAETPSESVSEAALKALRANVAETAAREEHTDPVVEVSHILIAFKEAARSSATRSQDEAEQLAADVLARVQAGEDFEALRQEFTDDRQSPEKPGEAVYRMSLEPKQRYYQRRQMVAAFGDVGWRLGVDEVGVSAYEPQNSPFGWHIIKRLK